MGEVLYIALTRPCTYLQMSGSSVLVKCVWKESWLAMRTEMSIHCIVD